MTDVTLVERLPVVYRIRDAELNGELEALIELIDEQVGLLRADLDGLWDDLFIETCADWVVPYIGDLVSNTPLHEIPDLTDCDTASLARALRKLLVDRAFAARLGAAARESVRLRFAAERSVARVGELYCALGLCALADAPAAHTGLKPAA